MNDDDKRCFGRLPAPPLRVTVNSSVRPPALQHLPHRHHLLDHLHRANQDDVGDDDFYIVIKTMLIIIMIIVKEGAVCWRKD